MIWLNPWAWIGLTAIAAPILVHLLARRRARPLLFPTLRFIGVSRPMLARRDRLSDLAVLAVRVTILAAAVAALAQPHIMTTGRQQQLNRTLARSVIVDTSDSMRRPTPAGGTALDAARREAGPLTQDAATHRLQESAAPARDLAGEVAWLATQPGRREVVFVSDFQTGTITAADVAHVPAEIGLRFVRVDVAAGSSPLELRSRTGSRETVARMTLSPTATGVEWTSRSRDAGTASSRLILLAGDAERPLADAAMDAARGISPPESSEHPVVIVFPEFAGRDALLQKATAIAEPWMFDAVAALRSNELLTTVSAGSEDPASIFSDAQFTAVTMGAEGHPLVVAASDGTGGRRRLLLFSSASARSLTSAALIAGVLSALSPSPPASELDPSTIGDETLKQWERNPGSAAPRADDRTASDGRWFWAVALLLLAVEAWMRRTRRLTAASHASEATHARVA